MSRKYRKKPVVIEAIEWDVSNANEIREWADTEREIVQVDMFLKIKTLEGTMVANPGDWIIKGVSGEIYPCKPDIFGMTYEAVE